MTSPTEKQINYAKKLGIENPENYTKIALSKMIDEKTGGTKNQSTPAQGQTIVNTSMARHEVVLTKVDKPHSLEIGKASKRHKIYYGDIEELKKHIEALKEAGFIDLDDLVPHEKV